MNRERCATQHELLGWWLAELEPAEESRLDEHLFACPGCSRRLQALLTLGEGIRQALRGGELAFVAPTAFLRRLKDAGLSIREYALSPGGSVNCTISPTDDLVVAQVAAPLAGVTRLDLLIDDSVMGRFRVEDVPFDRESGTLAVVPRAQFLRTLAHARQQLRLVAIEDGAERVLGDYTFNHHPFAGP